MKDSDDRPSATLRLGDATWHDGPGWYYVIDEYPDEGSCGALATADEAVRHAEADGYSIDRDTQPLDTVVVDVPHEGSL